MKKTPKILPTYYKSPGTPIFRDTTALPFALGGPIEDEPGTPPSWNRPQLSEERIAALKALHGDSIFASANPNDLLFYDLNKEAIDNATDFSAFLDPSASVSKSFKEAPTTKDIKIRLGKGWALDTKTGAYFKVPEELYKEIVTPKEEPMETIKTLDPALVDRKPLGSLVVPEFPAFPTYQMPGYMKSYNFPTVGRYTPLAAKAVQKVTGYDRNFMEGYYDEEGNYVPGELENAREQNRAPQFQGASSLKDIFAQRAYLQQLENSKSFAQGGTIHFERSEYGSDAREHYDNGGPIYTYSKRPGSFYQRAADGSWMINNSSTGGQYVPINDPTGERTALLNKNAVVYNPPAQGAPKPVVNQAVWENASGTSQQNAIAREKQLQALKASPVLADKEKAAQIEQQRAASEAEYMNQLRQSSQYEQPLDMMDWLWGAATVGPTIAPAAWTAAETVGTATLPYIEGALSTSIPGMASIPGATLGNAAGAYFAGDAIVNRLPQIPKQISKGEYADAAANAITGGLDIAGAGLVSPLYQGAKSTASELGKVLGTEEGLLSNTYRINPFAFKPQEGMMYRGLGQEGYTDAIQSGVFRPKQYTYPEEMSFGEIADAPKQFDNTFYAPAEKFGIVQNYGPKYLAEVPFEGNQFGRRYKGKNWSWSTPREIPIDEGRILQKDWLRGYKEVPKELPGSPNGTFAYRNVTSSRVRSTNTGLTNADVDTEVAKNIEWITSSEYARRRAANTGESLQEIQKSVDSIIKDANKAKFDLNANPRIMNLYDAAGNMKSKEWFRPAKVKVSADAEQPVQTLNHEIKHLYSPAIHNRNRLYDNYPTLGDKFDDYLAIGAEQQVRHLNAREQILAENNLPIDAQLSEEQVREFVDRWASKMNKMNKTDDFSAQEDFDAIWNDEGAKIQKEMLKARYNTDDVNFIGTLPTSQKVRFMSEYRDRLTRSITNALNKAWAAVPVGGAALLNNSNNQEENK